MGRLLRRKRVSRDPTVYPSNEGIGEGSLQRFITELLRVEIERYLNVLRGRPAFVGARQFIYWIQHRPTTRVVPAVFVLPGIKPGIKVDSWKLWERGVPPSLAIEMVSDDWQRDYRDVPLRYDELGTSELVIFDPESEDHKGRVRWQVYRRLSQSGFVRTEAHDNDRVRSRVLGCWLRSVGNDLDSLRLRLALDPDGDVLIPTELEEAEARLAAEHAALQAERAAHEAERAARENAEAELAKLRGELSQLKRR